MNPKVVLGIDRFLQKTDAYASKRLALVTNDVAVTSEGIKSRVALLQNGFKLVRLFSPEHGLSALGADGALQQDTTDLVTGLPVVSLYGERLAPSAEDLEDTDLVLFDIPDVGCRFYSYLWTMTYVMESCAAAGKPLLILDRPNPIGGSILLSEGPFLDEQHCASFIGRWSIPIRHSCTLGELATYFVATKIQSLTLGVVPVKGWQRDQMIEAADFIPTSPAITTISTALLYPGMGLLEGIYVNEGRGTSRPFHVVGAPWIRGADLQKAFEERNCTGVIGKSCVYTPIDSLYAGQICEGLEFLITDAQEFRPVVMGVALLQILLSLYPQQVEERLYKTRANPSGSSHLDKLLGVPQALAKLKEGVSIDTAVAEEWSGRIQSFLLY
jgi:uncharacterized protein YbbC (DUF1343 family)